MTRQWQEFINLLRRFKCIPPLASSKLKQFGGTAIIGSSASHNYRCASAGNAWFGGLEMQGCNFIWWIKLWTFMRTYYEQALLYIHLQSHMYACAYMWLNFSTCITLSLPYRQRGACTPPPLPSPFSDWNWQTINSMQSGIFNQEPMHECLNGAN